MARHGGLCQGCWNGLVIPGTPRLRHVRPAVRRRDRGRGDLRPVHGRSAPA
ncbi:hypothetical protein ACFSTD_12245 [Novosphingobium colocasiae]